MKYGCFALALALVFWLGCRTSSGSLVKNVKPETGVQKAFKRYQDLNATRANLTGELTEVRDQLFTLPKGAPLTMELTRRYATLNSRVSELAGEVTGAKFEWQAELKKAEAAKIQEKEQEKNAKEVSKANKVVAAQGALKLYTFSIKSDPNTGTSSVKGRVENSGSVSVTDVTVMFELFDADNKTVGTASDFIANIEPNSVWDFNALSPVDGAARAEFKSLKASGDLPPLPNPVKPE